MSTLVMTVGLLIVTAPPTDKQTVQAATPLRESANIDYSHSQSQQAGFEPMGSVQSFEYAHGGSYNSRNGDCSRCISSHGHMSPCLGHCHGGYGIHGHEFTFLNEWIHSPCNMPQHYRYHPAAHGYFYFRPYHFAHVPTQQEIAATQFGIDKRIPYSNKILEQAYRDLTEERASRLPLEEVPNPLHTDESPSDPPRPLDDSAPPKPESSDDEGASIEIKPVIRPVSLGNAVRFAPPIPSSRSK